MYNISAVILAAGEGKRMKSEIPKVIHKIMGKPLVCWVMEACNEAGAENLTLVVGHKSEAVINCLPKNTNFVSQLERLGTGHAVMQATEQIKSSKNVIILCGDTPLISADTLKNALKYKNDNNLSAVILSADFKNPFGYGRIIKNEKNEVLKIVEEKDATDDEKKVTEGNSGTYIFESTDLLDALSKIGNKNAQGEYYLTDTIEIILNNNKKVGSFMIKEENEVLGINDKIQLAEANAIMKIRINEEHMKNGVIIEDPATTYIAKGVKIASDTVIMPNTTIQGDTEIGSNCVIGPNTIIKNSKIGNDNEILASVVTDAIVENGVHIGPFAYLRPKAHIQNNAKIGDFVEIKNANIGEGTKVSHLTYIGDADVGKKCNFGCGTVFVNYNGRDKNRSVIGDNAFIGCNTNIVSPVNVGDYSYTAAGSTITEDVPSGALGIGRAKQQNKEGWVDNRGYLKK